MRFILLLALAAAAAAGPARAKGHDDDGGHGGYEHDRGRGSDRRDYRHDDHPYRRDFDQRRWREIEHERYGYARPPAYYPWAGPAYAPPVYAPPGLNLFIPFR